MLYIGPMSRNIVDVVVEMPNVGFCASRRQIEYDGGYVNNWTTEDFVKYIRERSSDVLICRDHGGPGQGKKEDDGFISFEHDAKTMDIIHIDPWKKFRSLKKAVIKTAEYIKFCDNVNSGCLYEVGTEEAIRRITCDELYVFLRKLKVELGSKLFKKITYAVIQSGTFLEEDRNTGEYDRERLENMINVCKAFDLQSKEHNGDYLSSKIIKEKFSLGLDAINIAPEFGIIETSCVLNRMSDNYGVFNKVYELCYNSGKWKKWVSADFDPFLNKKRLIKICCHYIFSNETFKELLKLDIFDGINDEIISKIKTRINEIIN